MGDDMRPSVPLELPRAKGDLTKADDISRAKALSGRSLPLLARACVAESDGAAASFTAADPEGSFSCLRFLRNTW
jgi:hypothetical protein